jgi:hypothetical protein
LSCRDARHLALSALPLLREIAQHINASFPAPATPATPASPASPKPLSEDRLSLFSGHDITLFPLLHALGAELAVKQNRWPTYGSSVTLEVLDSDYRSSRDRGEHGDLDAIRLRASWDLQPIVLNLRHFDALLRAEDPAAAEIVLAREAEAEEGYAPSSSFSVKELKALMWKLQRFIAIQGSPS